MKLVKIQTNGFLSSTKKLKNNLSLVSGIRRKFLQITSAVISFFFIASFALIAVSQDSYAVSDTGPGRVRACGASGEVEGLSEFLPRPGGNSKDLLFVMSNPVCISIAVGSYAAVKVAITAMNYGCGNSGGIRIVPSPILDLIDIAKCTKNAVQREDPVCGGLVTAASGALLDWVVAIGIIYNTANATSANTRICGADWMAPNKNTYDFSTPNYKQKVINEVNRLYREDPEKLNLSSGSREYREDYFGGKEFVDNPEDGSSACLDPTVSKDNYPRQKYYLRGSERGNFNCDKYKVLPGQNDPLTNLPYETKRQADMRAAYECCVRRSQEYICVEYSLDSGLIGAVNAVTGSATAVSNGITGRNDSLETSGRMAKFCRGGQNCTIGGITFSTKFHDNNRLICAESYSLCPYNFAIGFGTKSCDYYQDGVWQSDGGYWKQIKQAQVDAKDCAGASEIRNSDCTYNDKAGKCRNYCQYMQHCTRTGVPAFNYKSGLGSPYFSSACKNFVGDSQNKVSYGLSAFGGAAKNFSAPIAQCVSETLVNVFYNRAGHSECSGINEEPSADGTCPSGGYNSIGRFTYKVGNDVNAKSFFAILQEKMQMAVKMALILSMMFYGMNILLGKADLRSKKDILMYIIKFAVVGYFAMGTAWQSVFFNGVYNASSEFSRLVFKVSADKNIEKRDGCQFMDFTLSDGTFVSSGIYYPKGKQYLALWDTLDCKIMLYLGFGPEASVANIALLILAAFFTGPIGLYIALSAMAFGFFFIAATIRALHIFLSSSLAIVLFVFVSPLIFPLMLFERTKGIFDGWLKNLISFTLQPMLLFAYIAIFVTIMDQAFIGSATFRGQAPAKTLSCDIFCKDAYGNIKTTDDSGAPYVCNHRGDVEVDPMSDSMACLIGFNKFGKFPGLELFGIGIPFLWDFLTKDPKQKMLTFLRSMLVMYLIYKFMDEIPGMTNDLIGGTPVPSSKNDPFAMFKKFAEVAAAGQQRGAGAARKLVEGAVDKAKSGVKNLKETTRDSAQPAGGKSGGDHADSSKSGGDKAGGEDKGGDKSGDKK